MANGKYPIANGKWQMAEQTPCQLLSAALGFSLLRKPVVLKLITYQLLLPVRFWPRDKAELSRLSFGCFSWLPSMLSHAMHNWIGWVVCHFQVRYHRTIIERRDTEIMDSFFQQSDSNPGQPGAMRQCYRCAMPSPTRKGLLNIIVTGFLSKIE